MDFIAERLPCALDLLTKDMSIASPEPKKTNENNVAVSIIEESPGTFLIKGVSKLDKEYETAKKIPGN